MMTDEIRQTLVCYGHMLKYGLHYYVQCTCVYIHIMNTRKLFLFTR
jgi:hypothetical protein